MLKRFALVFSLAVCMALSMVTPTFAGDLRGTITWQYNQIVGTKADVGATVWLWPMSPSADTRLTKSEEHSWLGGFESFPEKAHLVATVDGYGRYEMYNIPEGKYYIWILSNHATRDFTDKQAMREELNFITEKAMTYPENKEVTIKICSTIWKTYNRHYMTIKKGQNIFNYDFGYKFL